MRNNAFLPSDFPASTARKSELKIVEDCPVPRPRRSSIVDQTSRDMDNRLSISKSAATMRRSSTSSAASTLDLKYRKSEAFAAPLRKDLLSVKSFQPKKRKASILVWTDLSVSSLDQLNESDSIDHIKEVLADIFVLDHYKTNNKLGIIMDLFFNTLRFAKQETFSPEKTSAFFSIIKNLFEVCIETPFNNLDSTREYFHDLLQCHSVNCPPFSIPLFTSKDIMRISQYTANTFFRHFDMYKYAFTPEIELELTLMYTGMSQSTTPEDESGGRSTSDSDDVYSHDILKDRPEKVSSEYLASIDTECAKQEAIEFLSKEGKVIQGKIRQKIDSIAGALYSKLSQMVPPEAVVSNKQHEDKRHSKDNAAVNAKQHQEEKRFSKGLQD